ncbi:malate dehydrogenase (quinone) [Pseudoclavibacter chungangensis]|uniref:Probable malate:quinone oxidoreductase n=2 Tax=Pseudoclavibacter chungangensis TaxID=587635 RepID=A0A7J5BTH3_9MICO|nr:malate dehydrogenase (quinone) [Pseudoclavibacter chungangensis]
MSATLGSIISKLEPDWSIKIIERLDELALESSNPWNNAGTGHAAYCELNYTPEKNGTMTSEKAVTINQQYFTSREFWSLLVGAGELPEPERFINTVPHLTFVQGADNVAFLKRRWELLKAEPAFADMQFSDDPAIIAEWAPALVVGRDVDEKIAATYMPIGTDVDFGALTNLLVDGLRGNGAEVTLGTEVIDLRQQRDGVWQILSRKRSGEDRGRKSVTRARFVFVGAGGRALTLLQKAKIPEIRGYGGFPISGQFLRTDNPEVVAKHQAKVYGKASVGAPPMSVPHLDTRVVNGKKWLMFGPYAGFSPKYLKHGSYLDLFSSLRLHNILPMLAVARDNFDLVTYLVGQVLAPRRKKFAELTKFFPEAESKDWELITAGQRVQVMKRDAKRGGVLQMGTEVISKADGTIAGLLGASPGATVAVPVMLDVLKRCFPTRYDDWSARLGELMPDFGKRVNDSAEEAEHVLTATNERLGLHPQR